MKILIQTKVENELQNVIPKFDLSLFKKLSPPLVKLNVLRFDGCQLNDEIHLDLKLLGFISQKWVSRVTSSQLSDTQFIFTDIGEQLPFPLRTWHHTHHITQDKNNLKQTIIIDDIEYQTGHITLDCTLYPFLYLMFYYRKNVYQKNLSTREK